MKILQQPNLIASSLIRQELLGALALLFSQSGYGLENFAAHFGINFKRHDAEEDAHAVRKKAEALVIFPDYWFERL